MRSFFAPLAFALAGGVCSQQTFEVCGLEEFCFCWDGTAQSADYAFVCSANPKVTLTLAFCAGQMDPNSVIRAYSGSANSDTPITELTGSFATLGSPVVTGTSLNNALFMEFDLADAAIGFPLCGDGLTSPWRWVVYVTSDDPDEPMPTCVNFGPDCLTTGMDVQQASPVLLVRDNHLFLTGSFGNATRIELLDSSGRTVGSLSSQGRASVALPTTLRAGVYVAVVESGTSRTTTRFVLHE